MRFSKIVLARLTVHILASRLNLADFLQHGFLQFQEGFRLLILEQKKVAGIKKFTFHFNTLLLGHAKTCFSQAVSKVRVA